MDVNQSAWAKQIQTMAGQGECTPLQGPAKSSGLQGVINIGRNSPPARSVPTASHDAVLRMSSSMTLPYQQIAMPPSDAMPVPFAASNTDLTAQRAQLQAQQITGAIRLLQMQYEAIMSNVQSSVLQRPTQDPTMHSAPGGSRPPTDPRQNNFANQFDLPAPDLGAVPSGLQMNQLLPHSSPGMHFPSQGQQSASYTSIHQKHIPAPAHSASNRADQDSKRPIATTICTPSQPESRDGPPAHRKRHAEDALVERSSKLMASNTAAGKLVLTAETACAIYEMRPKVWARRGGKSRSQSARIAAVHGVTAKTIRDIWNRSTWAKATRHLWTEEEVRNYVEQRRRLSARLDPAHGLPNWCGADPADAADAAGPAAAAAKAGSKGDNGPAGVAMARAEGAGPAAAAAAAAAASGEEESGGEGEDEDDSDNE